MEIHEISLIFDGFSWKNNEILWISMISQGSLGNLQYISSTPQDVCRPSADQVSALPCRSSAVDVSEPVYLRELFVIKLGYKESAVTGLVRNIRARVRHSLNFARHAELTYGTTPAAHELNESRPLDEGA